MSNDSLRERDSLAEFFDSMRDGRAAARAEAPASRPAALATRPGTPDLFKTILVELEGAATPAAAETGQPARRERAGAQFRQARQDEAEGEGLFVKSLGLLQVGAAELWLKWILGMLVAAVLIGVVYSIGSGIRTSFIASEQRAAAEQTKRDAFLKAGWRISERLGGDRPEEGGPIFRTDRFDTTVGYLKEISPEDGRILLKVTNTRQGYKYELSGWTREEAIRAKAIAELESVFPFKGNPGDVTIRPTGGALAPTELRTIAKENRLIVTPEGLTQNIGQLQYGECGYATVDPSRRIESLFAWRYATDDDKGKETPENIVTGRAPKKGEPYFVVIGGGGVYWQTPAQRELLIKKALEKVREAPDGGAAARRILLVYQDGDNLSIEKVDVWLQGNE